MCYKYDRQAELKTHDHFVEFADEWENLSPAERKNMLRERQTKGFKRPSSLRLWPKFDMVYEFCQDVMHQLDEGVVRWLVGELYL